MTRPARILPGPRCGWPDRCTDEGIAHSPEPGTRRVWGYHDKQCPVVNPRPGAHLAGRISSVRVAGGPRRYKGSEARALIAETLNPAVAGAVA